MAARIDFEDDNDITIPQDDYLFKISICDPSSLEGTFSVYVVFSCINW